MYHPNMFESHQHMFDMTPKESGNDLGLTGSREDDFETKSGAEVTMENLLEEELQDPNQRPNKKKRYHRHTQRQIQELESFFKECPHPDDKQRKELSRELNLEPLQIKFWFQNKRTQMKAQHERHDNSILKADNDKLRAENNRYKDALSNATCPNCGGPAAIGEMSFDEQHLRIENARLREEIDRISSIAAKYVGKPLLPHSSPSTQLTSSHYIPSRSLGLEVGNFGTNHQTSFVGEMHGTSDIMRSVSIPCEADKPMIVELAVAALEELVTMAQTGDPLWGLNDNLGEILNEEEYFRMFPRGIGPKPIGFRSEASRESTVVIMNHINLVEILMNVNQYSSVFCGIVSRALTLEVLSTGIAGNYNGALQVMTAEFQVPSPLVPTRENYFLRYCKQHGDNTWAVVDVSLDNLRPSPITRSRRRPSGCLIQELQNGYSKVTWVEHMEVDDRSVHTMYKPLVNTGLAFGAKRWVATLDRQCERLASSMASNIPTGDLSVITSPEGRKSMLKLAERMVMSFFSGVGASTAHAWTTLATTGSDDVRVMTRKSMDDPGRPPGIVLSAATSFWIPVAPKRVFDFLRDENSRSEWDILSNGGLVQKMAHIANGRDPGNSISLLRVNDTNSGPSNMLILQESCTDVSGSYVIYAPVDMTAMDVVLSGGDPDYVALLPSGFAILPDGGEGGNASAGAEGGGNNRVVVNAGSLLTVAFQIIVDSVPTAKLSLGSVATVNSLIKCTVERIKGKIADGSHGKVSVDHYHRYPGDLDLMKDLGVNSYRFSLSWARILPKGRFGDVNMEGINHYNRMINAILKRGMEPFVTLTHYDMPQELECRYGSWLNPQIREDFEHYAEICFRHFGNRVKFWTTFNEPNVQVILGYRKGTYPPSRCSKTFANCTRGGSDIEPLVAAHNIIRSHFAAVSLYRERFQEQQGGKIGIVMNAIWFEPVSDSLADSLAAERAQAFYLTWFLDPIVFGRYPREMQEILGQDLPKFTRDDLKISKNGLDFIGINQYTSRYAKDCLHSVCEPGKGGSRAEGFVHSNALKDGLPLGEPTGVNWFNVYPQGMEEMLMYATERYRNIPLYVTENGFGENSTGVLLNDYRRVKFMSNYLDALKRAMRKGADVRGYFTWSLLDNFEWISGYTVRFGMYHVDFNTLERTPRLSASWYKNFISKHISSQSKDDA
ncbi:unnamed protein product [Brassica rapa subsp. narinosa]